MKSGRPYMPGYGVLPAGEGTGLLPWSWAEERLARSHDYWVATAWPDGRPHVMPVWGLWRDGAVWFSSSVGSRKARNLAADPRCAVTSDNAQEPVVVEGAASRVTDRQVIAAFLSAFNAKYDANLEIDFFDPDVNATFRVEPRWAFALDEKDFSGSPTRWRFTS
jgi:nitroimidazol reductase NimA-like FMN-containing flavoprotein (pyridoxamine 5'-phosphate oxidase superfamily)